MDNSQRTYLALEKLSQCTLNCDQVPKPVLSRVVRLLRPSNGVIDASIHTHAIKMRLRNALLSKYGKSGDGPAAVAELEKEIDILRTNDSPNWKSFLALLEPLSFSAGNADTQRMNVNIDKLNSIRSFSSSVPSIKEIEEKKDSSIRRDHHHLNESKVTLIRDDSLWVTREVELILLKDLLLVFQGINGKSIKLDERSQSYILNPQLHVPPPARDCILCLCEVGWLFTRVNSYIRRVESSELKGLVSQALGYAFQSSLHDYFRLLAVLQQELGRADTADRIVYDPDTNLSIGLDASKSHASSVSTSVSSMLNALSAETMKSETSDSSNGLTLIRLRMWMQNPLERMCLMARLADSALPLSGGGLASRLHGHTFHGDTKMESLMKTIMQAVAAPIYKMITRWVLHGELVDDFKEFFITSASAHDTTGRALGGTEINLWHTLYRISKDNLPSFISTKLAHQILVVGKSINFMKACYQYSEKAAQQSDRTDRSGRGGKRESGISAPSMSEALGSGAGCDARRNEDNWDYSIIIRDEGLQASLQDIGYGNEDVLQQKVFRVANVIDSRLLTMLDEKFHLHDHLEALKKFMMLCQGDFVTLLMDTIGNELKKRANQLFRHNLTGMVESSLRACNAQFEPQYVLDRLGVRLLEASSGDSGWEIFSLDYIIDPPLAPVITQDAMTAYRTIFHMLWRMKRVEWTLSGAWKNLMAFRHTRGHHHLSKLQLVLHRCSLQRGKMTHLVNNLNNFFMLEVVETCWRKFDEEISTSKSLDDIISSHRVYLDSILERTLLTTTNEALNAQIQALLQTILRFCTLEETMIADALAITARRHNGGSFGWGGDVHPPEAIMEGPQTIDGIPGYIITRLEEAAHEYETQFRKFISMLQDKGEKSGEIYRYLTLRLDLENVVNQKSDFSMSNSADFLISINRKSFPTNLDASIMSAASNISMFEKVVSAPAVTHQTNGHRNSTTQLDSPESARGDTLSFMDEDIDGGYVSKSKARSSSAGRQRPNLSNASTATRTSFDDSAKSSTVRRNR